MSNLLSHRQLILLSAYHIIIISLVHIRHNAGGGTRLDTCRQSVGNRAPLESTTHRSACTACAPAQYSAMAEGEQATEAAPAAESQESSGSGFYNRRLHNYPLIKV